MFHTFYRNLLGCLLLCNALATRPYRGHEENVKLVFEGPVMSRQEMNKTKTPQPTDVSTDEDTEALGQTKTPDVSTLCEAKMNFGHKQQCKLISAEMTYCKREPYKSCCHSCKVEEIDFGGAGADTKKKYRNIGASVSPELLSAETASLDTEYKAPKGCCHNIPEFRWESPGVGGVDTWHGVDARDGLTKAMDKAYHVRRFFNERVNKFLNGQIRGRAREKLEVHNCRAHSLKAYDSCMEDAEDAIWMFTNDISQKGQIHVLKNDKEELFPVGGGPWKEGDSNSWPVDSAGVHGSFLRVVFIPDMPCQESSLKQAEVTLRAYDVDPGTSACSSKNLCFNSIGAYLKEGNEDLEGAEEASSLKNSTRQLSKCLESGGKLNKACKEWFQCMDGHGEATVASRKVSVLKGMLNSFHSFGMLADRDVGPKGSPGSQQRPKGVSLVESATAMLQRSQQGIASFAALDRSLSPKGATTESAEKKTETAEKQTEKVEPQAEKAEKVEAKVEKPQTAAEVGKGPIGAEPPIIVKSPAASEAPAPEAPSAESRTPKKETQTKEEGAEATPGIQVEQDIQRTAAEDGDMFPEIRPQGLQGVAGQGASNAKEPKQQAVGALAEARRQGGQAAKQAMEKAKELKQGAAEAGKAGWKASWQAAGQGLEALGKAAGFVAGSSGRPAWCDSVGQEDSGVEDLMVHCHCLVKLQAFCEKESLKSDVVACSEKHFKSYYEYTCNGATIEGDVKVCSEKEGKEVLALYGEDHMTSSEPVSESRAHDFDEGNA